MTPEQFMLAEAQKPFAYGLSDCAQACARWVEHRTGLNPLLSFNRPYDDHGAASWLAERPLVRSVMHVMRRADLARIHDPHCGDIGVIASSSMAAVALHGSTHWLYLTEAGGLCAVPADRTRCLAAWRIP